MDPSSLAAIGALLGVIQSASQAQAQNKQRGVNAAMNYTSPWTHQAPKDAPPSAPDWAGNVAGGAFGGLAASQSPWMQAMNANATPQQTGQATAVNPYASGIQSVNGTDQNPNFMGPRQ